ncbi:T6SS effector BTH_I2691 family protein [Alloalcanivorax xenomutans]|uniref:T6SS effector BTH_I2691 family protein n=1 Tax=Alloalcanivorax xenomutans TaxID=1094342 RepID=UPI0024E1ABB4|nr:T6SS effector BTH_I2691 family protein [Alloalcanivorax xenomutans]
MPQQEARESTNNGANIVRANAQASEAVARGASHEGCPFCMRTGVPILPLRYALIPSYLSAGRGSASIGELLPNSALNNTPSLQKHRYTMRTLRAGYVYVYLNTPGQWQVYTVTPAGNLRLVEDPDDFDEKSCREMSEQCQRNGDNIPASFIHIEDPERTPVIWLAFSTARWTPAVRERYEKDPAGRMQQFNCANLMRTPDQVPDAFELHDETASRLSGWVEEFLDEDEAETDRRRFMSGEVGNVNSKLYNWDSVHGHHARQGHAEQLSEYARCYREARKGRKVAAVVLHDALGMVEEANGTRLHYVENRQAYCTRYQRQAMVSQSILGLKAMYEHAALAARTKQEEAEGIPDVVTETISFGRPEYSLELSEEITSTRAERAHTDFILTWQKLQKKYNERERQQFEEDYGNVLERYASQIADADADWVAWAQSPDWLAWLDDYDPEDVACRVQMTQDAAPCLAGGVLDTPSHELWKSWLEMSPLEPANPVYRALFGNDQNILEYLVPEDGQLNKGSMLYGHIKSVIQAEEFTRQISVPLKQATSEIQLAIAGATSAVERRLKEMEQTIDRAPKAIANQAQQAVILLLEGVEVSIVKVRLKLGVYQRLMSDIAFGAIEDAQRLVTQLADEAGRTVRNMTLTGVLSIDSPELRDTIVEVAVWTYGKVEDLSQSLGEAAERVKNQIHGASSAFERTLGGLTAHALALNSSTLAALERATVNLPLGQAAAWARSVTTKSLRVVGSSSLILSAGALYFQKWAVEDAREALDKQLGSQLNEAELALVSAWTGTIGVATEMVGFAYREAGKAMGREALERVGGVLVKGGGIIATTASIVDGVQNIFSAVRTGRRGDTDAMYLYAFASAAYIGGAAAGIGVALAGSTALLGPLGIALGLIAIGAILTWAAINAEDTQAEIWLDRCYFGYGERSEGKWTDGQAVEELKQLNAIYAGLSATMGFSDPWLGLKEMIFDYDRIDLKIRFGSFNEKSAYEWRLWITHESRGEVVAAGGRHGMPPPQHYVTAAPRRSAFSWLSDDRPDKWIGDRTDFEGYRDNVWTVEEKVEVQSGRFVEARLEVTFWLDFDDRAAVATLEMKDED